MSKHTEHIQVIGRFNRSLWSRKKEGVILNPKHHLISRDHLSAADSIQNAIRLSKWRRKWDEIMKKVHDKFNLKTNRP